MYLKVDNSQDVSLISSQLTKQCQVKHKARKCCSLHFRVSGLLLECSEKQCHMVATCSHSVAGDEDVAL